MSEPRTRHACEPCRRKKTRCTAERPVCSFCKRLDIQCTYMPRGTSEAAGVERRRPRTSHSSPASGESRTPNTEGRFRQLELQVNSLYDLLRTPSASSVPHYLHNSSVSPRDAIRNISAPSLAQDNARHAPASLGDTNKSIRDEFELSRNVLEHFVGVYRDKLHLQPLPLFRLETLVEDLMKAQQGLMWSFMSLLLNLSTHESFTGREATAREFYTRSAEDTVLRFASEGDSTLEVTQSLCLIALMHIQTRQFPRAWMTIGTASRLISLHTLSRDNSTSPPDDDMVRRAFWSVYILERLFIPNTPEPSTSQAPNYPASSPPPPLPLAVESIAGTPAGSRISRETRGASAATTPIKDIGINGHAIRLLRVWGKTMRYMHELRRGDLEKPWLSESRHSRLNIELFENEALLDRQHLVINTAMGKRTASEVASQRDYWYPWLTTQIVSHACQAILNHPFLHLCVLRQGEGLSHPRGFLQQTVDLALYHAGWVVKLVQGSQGLLAIHDPLIGDVVAAVATVPWLFQFARDSQVAERARDDFASCKRFLSQLALTWPYISAKDEVLQKLQMLAEGNRQEYTEQSTSISFKSAWFWKLLDPKIVKPSDARSHSLQSTPASPGDSNDTDARINLKTQFVHPLRETHDQVDRHGQQQQPQELFTSSMGDPMGDMFVSPENLEQFYINDLSREFLSDDLWGQGSLLG